jgi:predicted dehydrogenase
MSIDTLPRPRPRVHLHHAAGGSPLLAAIVGIDSDAGRLLADALARHGDAVRLAAVVEPRAGIWELRPGLAGVARFDDLAGLIASGIAVDLLVVAASDEPLLSVVGRAVDQRWHVLCDRPFTYDMAVAGELVAAALDRQRRLMLASPRRFMAASAVDLVDAGAFGAVWHVAASWKRAGAPGADTRWRDQPDAVVEQLAGPLLELALPFFGAAVPRALRVTTPLGGRIQTAIIQVELTGGGVLDLATGEEPTLVGPDQSALAVWGARAELTARLPVGDGPQSAQASPPLLRPTGGGWRPIARFRTLAECYAEAFDAALQAIGGGDPAGAGDPLGPIALGAALRASIERKGAPVWLR